MMVFFSSRIAFAAFLFAATGCSTGILIESGRLHERVSSYETFTIDGQDLLLDYTVEVSRMPWGEKPILLGNDERAAILPIPDLDAHPPHRPDAFPLRRIPPGANRRTSLPIRLTSEDAENETSVIRRSSTTGIGSTFLNSTSATSVEIWVDSERHQGFHLCHAQSSFSESEFESKSLQTTSHDAPAPDVSTSPVACGGFFHSAALYDSRFAWWVYTAAPMTLVFDIALLPIQALTLPILIVFGD